ncbi:class I SAM-dependent methyltransferase [Patescibacteria group bacterium]
MRKKIEILKKNRIYTAERPFIFEADVAARYAFAAAFCKNKSVLDVGSGLGQGAMFLADSGAKNVLGIDYDSDTVRHASAVNESSKVKFRCLEAIDIGKIKRKFDVVLAFEILEHLEKDDVRKFVNLLSNSLAEGGILLLTTPNGAKTDYVLGKPYNPYHVHEYSGKELKKILGERFKHVEIKGIRQDNQKCQRQQLKLEKSIMYKPIYFLGHFRVIRELSPYIPRHIKNLVTKENSLPTLTKDDFLLTSNLKNCPGLFVSANN